MIRIILTIVALAALSIGANAQNVNIPDANFKACLLAYSNINTNGDDEIQVSEANAFTGGFTCVNQNISDLTGIEAFTSMIILNCSDNNLSSLDISQNTALKRLFCTNTNLNNLDVTQNSALEYLVCGDNNLNSLDISQNTNLTNLQCQNNNLNSLDVSPHWNLKNFRCQGNNLTSLDVSNNAQLQDFQCQNNQLNSLNIKNVNWNVFWVNASTNPNLTCIEVDDVAVATAANTNIDPQTNFSTSCSQIVNIPDANFKAYLVGNSEINTNADDEIQLSEAQGFNGTISCQSQNVSDLTGIEAFIGLTELYVISNNFSTIDVSQNAALTTLHCGNNSILSSVNVSQNAALTDLNTWNSPSLSTLDISQNTALTRLVLAKNNLTTLDVSQNTALEYLNCEQNSLSSLDLSQNTALEYLNCLTNSLNALDLNQNTALTLLLAGYNNLSTLDLSQNTALVEVAVPHNSLTSLNVGQSNALTLLQCNFNDLSSVDISQNTSLNYFYCRDNNLNNLDVSQNTALMEFNCEDNQISTLNVSQSPGLILFNCNSNNLTELNMKNISTNLLEDFEADSNPDLTCIEVDDVAAAIAVWTNIDPQTNFSESCAIAVTSINVQGQGGASTISTQGGTLQMNASVLPANADDATYTWSVTNGTGSANINTSGLLTADTDGTVTVTATANDGSGVTGSTVITISNQSVGIEQLSANHNVNLFPNPAAAQLSIDTDEKIEAITIVDLKGTSLEINNFSNNTIDVSQLPKGIYFLQIQMKNVLVYKKFYKE